MAVPEENDLVEPDAPDFDEDDLVSDLEEVTDLPEAPNPDTHDPDVGGDEEKPAKKAAAKKTAKKASTGGDDS